MEDRFLDIRPFSDTEFQYEIDQLLAQTELVGMVDRIFGNDILRNLQQKRNRFRTLNDFIVNTTYPLLDILLKRKHSQVTYGGQDNLSESAVYLSNHRDIISDPAFFQYSLVKGGFPTSEIGIGSNLAAAPWILSLMKLNKSFVVKRNLPKAEQMKSLVELSEYINYTIKEKKASIWLAHREGRAKDSNDCTQPSLLKMLALKGNGSFLENLKSLNITPVSISYEYDPCDYLKAKEFQQRRDNADFKKSKADDVVSMQTGLMGFASEIHFQITQPINSELDRIASMGLPRTQEVEQVAVIIDRQIHSSYKIFKTNYMALDMLYGENRFENFYNSQEKVNFAKYIDTQISRIDLPSVDYEFCKEKILQNYSNTLVNYLRSKE